MEDLHFKLDERSLKANLDLIGRSAVYKSKESALSFRDFLNFMFVTDGIIREPIQDSRCGVQIKSCIHR